MAVSRRLRYEILRRDEFRCRYCGAEAPEVKLTVDHVVPTALGGADDPKNLVTACAACNAGKTSTSPDESIVEDVAHDALRWRQAMEQAAEIQVGQRERRDAYVEAFDCAWRQWTATDNDGLIERPENWVESLARFSDLGLNGLEMLDAIDKAMGGRRTGSLGVWRYFCGICWGILREQQEIAAGLLAHDDEDKA